MRRRAFLQSVVALSGGAALPAAAQRRQRVAIIALDRDFSPFVQTLAELGYVEGRNIEYGRPIGLESNAALSRLAEQAVGQRADVMLAFGASAAKAAAKTTRTIPIVILINADPVELGLAKDLAHPGGNVTGIAMLGQVLAQKQVELLKEFVPGMRRLGVVFDPASVGNRQVVKYVAEAGSRIGIETQPIEVSAPDGVARMPAQVKAARSEALLVFGSVALFPQRAKIIGSVAELRLPAIYGSSSYVRGGGLAAFGVDYSAQFRRAAYFVARLLKGAKPADLPIEQPTKFELIVNRKTANALGLQIPQGLLMRADEVIE